MIDFAGLRTKMVDGQVRPNDVTDHGIIGAMLTVPREDFAPEALRELAYLDRDLPLGDLAGARVLIQPMVFAKLLQTAEIKATDKVLEVGTATGYGAAVIARLAASVVALEEDAAFAAKARVALADLANVTVEVGKLSDGAAAKGPFNVIILNGSAEKLPAKLLDQLADGGRLLYVEAREQGSKATLTVKNGAALSTRALFTAAEPLLPGFAAEPAFVF